MSTAPAAAPVAAVSGDVAAGPAIRRFAREVGVDLSKVAGSGAGGRVTREDVLNVVRHANRQGTVGGAPSAGAAAVATPGADGQATASDSWGPIRVEKMSRIRRTIAEQMHRSWTTVPRVTNFDDADITDLEEFRQQSKDDYASQGIKLTTMPFVIKAVAMALRAHPALNANINMEQGEVTYKEYVNVGIAVDTDRGLVVPSLRNADRLSIPDVAKRLSEIAESARTNSFSIDDMRGSTFTISNLGAIGGTYSTPIVNVPETAILLLGRSRKLPVVIGDEVQIRLMMPLSLSYDHRIVDGAMAARFLNTIIGYLKAPSRLLLAL
ncbi:MAG: 2-oxo acid dehydrogenase subunit E2 [Pirellulaceae bacterium]